MRLFRYPVIISMIEPTYLYCRVIQIRLCYKLSKPLNKHQWVRLSDFG